MGHLKYNAGYIPFCAILLHERAVRPFERERTCWKDRHHRSLPKNQKIEFAGCSKSEDVVKGA